ncbi:MAG: hydroxyacid dehydrogenase [bacterium]|nr:hydroxyacid dehydrogenase [bacterium]
MKILITDPEYFSEPAREIMRGVGEVIAKKYTNEELLGEVADAHALAIRVTTVVDRGVLDAAHSLKIIGSATTGINHIDVEYAEAKGVRVVSLPGHNTISTAEFTFATLLSLVKRIPWAHQHTLSGAWDRARFMGTELSGKTLGLIGFGRIGRAVATYAAAFGMAVVYADPYLEVDVARDAGARKVSLQELLAIADIVSVHAFLSSETESMIGYEELKTMKPTAVIINAARGNIVNEDALLTALQEGIIAGAALDVFGNEPLAQDNPLIHYAANHDNLILTPHIGGSSREAVEQSGIYVAEKIREVLQTL